MGEPITILHSFIFNRKLENANLCIIVKMIRENPDGGVR